MWLLLDWGMNCLIWKVKSDYVNRVSSVMNNKRSVTINGHQYWPNRSVEVAGETISRSIRLWPRKYGIVFSRYSCLRSGDVNFLESISENMELKVTLWELQLLHWIFQNFNVDQHQPSKDGRFWTAKWRMVLIWNKNLVEETVSCILGSSWNQQQHSV